MKLACKYKCSVLSSQTRLLSTYVLILFTEGQLLLKYGQITYLAECSCSQHYPLPYPDMHGMCGEIE